MVAIYPEERGELAIHKPFGGGIGWSRSVVTPGAARIRDALEVDDQPLVARARESAVAEAKTTRRSGLAQQRLDLLDGLMIRRVRQARKAARAAARELGDPRVAEAFELRTLYRR